MRGVEVGAQAARGVGSKASAAKPSARFAGKRFVYFEFRPQSQNGA